MRALLTALALIGWLAPFVVQRTLAQESAPPPPVLTTFSLDAGLGVGTRSYERPYDGQLQVLETTPFVAADVALRLRRCATDCPTAHYALDFLLRYQTSIGMQVEAPMLFALPGEVDARASRLELSVAPSFRLGSAAASPSIAVPIGAMLRAFQAEHRDLPLPSYSLFGPHLRIEGRLPLGEHLELRAGPEAQWIAVIGNRLRDEGTAGSGFGLGFEVAASASLGACLGLELSYRQAHALASGKGDAADFEDIERFATLQLSWRPE
jgi:hypothetical protein